MVVTKVLVKVKSNYGLTVYLLVLLKHKVVDIQVLIQILEDGLDQITLDMVSKVVLLSVLVSLLQLTHLQLMLVLLLLSSMTAPMLHMIPALVI